MAEANDLTVGRVISQERKFKEISKINKHSR
ncbi:unknown [Clostridium sp. CAG:413]|nr:unknown [Clostridium sp. CAG:413]